MSSVSPIRRAPEPLSHYSNLFRNERGAIDLASIMVGIIVIGLIGGVVAATVFAVIPWTQDRAAKQQLDSIASAQSAYRGLSSSASLPENIAAANSYANSVDLEIANLLTQGETYCTVNSAKGVGYNAYAYSASGKVFQIADSNTKPEEFTGLVPKSCGFIVPPEVDTAPDLTSFTYKCDITTTGSLPTRENLQGTEKWSDGVTKEYSGDSSTSPRTLQAGVTYTVTFEGTYTSLRASDLNECLRSLDHWGTETGAVDALGVFQGAVNLTSVPNRIPESVKSLLNMFSGASKFNDPNVRSWDTSNVTNMDGMFRNTNSFNQPLDEWDTSNVTDMSYMFFMAYGFNQSLNSWDVSNVKDMNSMFNYAMLFDKPLNDWNTSNVANMKYMFQGASSFNQSLNSWNVSNVKYMNHMFEDAKKFDGAIGGWDVSNVEDMGNMFSGAIAFDQPLNGWNVSKVQNMGNMFSGASNFNQPLNDWKTQNVTNMRSMFFTAVNFDQPLNNWNVSKVQDMFSMFQGATNFNQPLNKWVTSEVTDTGRMFRHAVNFNQPLNDWDVSKVTNMDGMFLNAPKFNQPLNKWVTSKVTNMDGMFQEAAEFSYSLNNWDTQALASGTKFAPSTYPNDYMPAKTTK